MPHPFILGSLIFPTIVPPSREKAPNLQLCRILLLKIVYPRRSQSLSFVVPVTPSKLKCGFPIWENSEEYWYLMLKKFVFLKGFR